MYGINGAISAATILVSTTYKSNFDATNGRQILWSQLVAALVVLLACASLPRRPMVFFQGNRVDHEHGASILARLSFSWGPFHQTWAGGIPEKIGLRDLPAVAHNLRVRTLERRFRNKAGKAVLWRQIFRTFLARLIRQWLLVLLKALSGFGSRFAFHQLLECLESRLVRGSEAWMWVIGLGFGLLAETIVGGSLSWFTQMKLEMPVIALLNALVFEKTTRRQLVHGKSQANGGNEKEEQQPGPSLTDMISNDRYVSVPACSQIGVEMEQIH
jgi:hypothetical protein